MSEKLGWGMGKAIEASNIEIENSFSLETFRKDVIEVLSNYLGVDVANKSKKEFGK